MFYASQLLFTTLTTPFLTFVHLFLYLKSVWSISATGTRIFMAREQSRMKG